MLIGVDEVNFSPSIAGDCVVCALKAISKVEGVRDSKQLTHAQRLALWPKIEEASVYAVALATVHDINQVGVHLARNNTMITAVRHLLDKLYVLDALEMGAKDGNILLDGYFSAATLNFMRSKIGLPVNCMTKADEEIYEVSAASIVAKIYVDALFQGFGAFYPGYNMEVNHGSPDPVMYEQLRKRGPTPYHRTGYGAEWWKKIMEGGANGKDKNKD